MTRNGAWRPGRVAQRALWVLAYTLAIMGCREAHTPPPSFSVFGVTDKFFDVKSVSANTFLALAYGSKLLRTEDGGQKWQSVGRPSQRSLTRLSVAEGKVWAVGHQGKIFHSADGGATWKEQQSPTPNSLFDVDFVDANRGFAVGDQSSIVATADGGATWHPGKIEMSSIGVREDMSLAITDPIFYATDFLDGNTGWVVGEFGQIRFTEDGGATWSAQHESLLGSKYRDIMTLPTLLCVRARDREHALAVGTYGAILFTNDGGKTWQFSESPVGIPLYDIRLLPEGDALIVGSSGVILRGHPERGWQPAGVPPGVFTWIAAVDFDASGTGVAGGGHGLFLTSNDFGKNWQVTSYQ